MLKLVPRSNWQTVRAISQYLQHAGHALGSVHFGQGRLTIKIEIRDACANDAEALCALNEDVQALHAAAVPWLFKTHGLGVEAFKKILENSNSFLLVATAGSELVGYLYAEHRKYPETPLTYAYQILHVHHISVRDAFRKSGVGKALMNRLHEVGDAAGVNRISADVWSFNDNARKFFKTSGLSAYIERLWN